MPLQNRVDPFGELLAIPTRGLLFGNRGGRFHRDDQTLGRRRYASRQWICCVLSFKGRQRNVWGRYYTELFFLDEVTALAAGHRPCFECRRADATAFAERFVGKGVRPSAPDMDELLHAERLDRRNNSKRTYDSKLEDLPNGAVVTLSGMDAFAVKGDALLPWRPSGYGAPLPRPRNALVGVLTPPSIVNVLRRGFTPLWHPSANLSRA